MIEIIEQTTLEHFIFLPKKLGFEVFIDQNLHIINCGYGSSMFNIVFGGLDVDPSLWAGEVRKIIEKYKQPFAWWVPPSLHSGLLTQILINEGLTIETSEYAMICDLETHDFLQAQTRLEIRQVLTPEDLQDFISILEPYDPTARKFYEKLGSSTLDLNEKLFIGYKESRPVTMGILFQGSKANGIFSLITHENERGRGFGGDMMRHLMNFSKTHGQKYATLSASSQDALRIYQRLGFEVLGEFECFEYAVDKK
jgi:ribosomal protein S18 acetylase RimI-like enzyme